jgi:hypothetical protein
VYGKSTIRPTTNKCTPDSANCDLRDTIEDMLLIILAYFASTYIFTLVIGYLQTPYNHPDCRIESQTLATQTENSAWYSSLAVTAICIQAFISIILFQGTGGFPVAAVFLAFTLLSHHAVIHRNSDFSHETCSCIAFQCKDISNHETWVVSSIIAGVVSLAHL